MADDKFYRERFVPDDGPVGARILMVGEAPGEAEFNEGKPFIGPSGQILMNVLSRAGLERGEIRFANLCHYRPYDNKFENLLKTEVLKEGLAQLYQYIKDFRPTVIVPLGAYPLMFLTGKKGIGKWRGSIISYINDESIKVIPTYHPSAVLRDRGLYPTFDLDIRRVASDQHFPEKRLPQRQLICNPKGLELEEWVQKLCAAEFLGTDIETVKKSKHILCVGFAPSPDIGVSIATDTDAGKAAIQRILRSPAKKIFQFGQYDTAQLWENGYEICDPEAEVLNRIYFWDTLIAQHIMAPELPRSLEYLTSVYTREPYYKTEGRGSIPDDSKGWSMKVNKQSLYEYNARDCCVTIEVALQQMQELSEAPENLYATFAFEMELMETAQHIGMSGLPIDKDRRNLIEYVLLEKWQKKQFILDRMTGFKTNVRSPQLKKILYEHLGLPARRNRDGTLTTDEDAIVSLISFCKGKIEEVKKAETKMDWQIKLAVCQTILEIRGIRTLLSNYITEKMRDGTYRLSSDGRMKSVYGVAKTETGRWGCTKYVDGTGLNAQTLARDPIEIDDAVMERYEKWRKQQDNEELKREFTANLALLNTLTAEDEDAGDEEDEQEEAA